MRKNKFAMYDPRAPVQALLAPKCGREATSKSSGAVKEVLAKCIQANCHSISQDTGESSCHCLVFYFVQTIVYNLGEDYHAASLCLHMNDEWSELSINMFMLSIDCVP